MDSKHIQELVITNLVQSLYGKMTLNFSKLQTYIEFKVGTKFYDVLTIFKMAIRSFQ